MSEPMSTGCSWVEAWAQEMVVAKSYCCLVPALPIQHTPEDLGRCS